jgi:putative toxin-antitoxin system antitoxin component (TIGR02293 family)
LSLLGEALADGRITAAEVDRLALSRKTLARRRILGSLTPDQSDRLLRIIEETEAMFGDRAEAHTWLRRPTPLLDGEAPLARLDTDIGTRQVEAMLGRIAHWLGA